MYITLNDSDIPQTAGVAIEYNIPQTAGVAIEYNIPQTAKRVDFLLSGYGKTGEENVVIIELKQ